MLSFLKIGLITCGFYHHILSLSCLVLGTLNLTYIILTFPLLFIFVCECLVLFCPPFVFSLLEKKSTVESDSLINNM